MEITAKTRGRSRKAIAAAARVRQGVILALLQERGPMTAQEIANELHRLGHTTTSERNCAAPRLTELKDAGKVEATGKKICSKTGRSVTLWQVRKEAM